MLRDTDRQRERTLAMLFHELRGPISTARGWLFLLRRLPQGGEQAWRAVDTIDRQLAHLARLVEDLLLVEEDAIERAVQMLAEQQKVVAEGAGAAGLAAMIAHPARFAGRRVGLVICGGNIDSRMLATVLMRGMVRDGRMVTLRIQISDTPGVLGRLAKLVGDSGGNIIEIHHQRMFNDLPPKRADIDAVIETRNPEHYREIVGVLEADGFPTRLLSNLSRGADH